MKRKIHLVIFFMLLAFRSSSESSIRFCDQELNLWLDVIGRKVDSTFLSKEFEITQSKFSTDEGLEEWPAIKKKGKTCAFINEAGGNIYSLILDSFFLDDHVISTGEPVRVLLSYFPNAQMKAYQHNLYVEVNRTHYKLSFELDVGKLPSDFNITNYNLAKLNDVSDQIQDLKIIRIYLSEIS